MMFESQHAPKPLQRSLRQQLVDAIGGEIVRGGLKPGECLPSEEVLLTRYDVSRTVLRDALNVLSGKGLIDARPKRGTIVRPRADWNQLDSSVLSWLDSNETATSDQHRDSLDDLMEIRRIIEPSAAALAAQRRTAEDIAHMTAAYAAMEQARDAAEPFMEGDLAFHVASLQAAHNDFLLPVANAIRSALMTSLRVTNRDPEQNRLSLSLHREILDAIVARDSTSAMLAMERHLDDTEKRRTAAGRRWLPAHAKDQERKK